MLVARRAARAGLRPAEQASTAGSEEEKEEEEEQEVEGLAGDGSLTAELELTAQANDTDAVTAAAMLDEEEQDNGAVRHYWHGSGGGGGGGGDVGEEGRGSCRTSGRLTIPYAVRVRQLRIDEIPAVADIQAEAFYEKSGFELFDTALSKLFRAEVLAVLRAKLKSPPERYACLVAADEESDEPVGVGDVSILRDPEVCRWLPLDSDGTRMDYAYISSMAVDARVRRCGIANALLQGMDDVVLRWGLTHAALHVYANNYGAQQLYERAGFKVIASDPVWSTEWIGRTRRLLMLKQLRQQQEQ
eukprot:jgi/Chlat1/7023/Chrsp56S06662